MEKLWADLTREEKKLKSPAGHEVVLKDREAAYEAGKQTVSDWNRRRKGSRRRSHENKNSHPERDLEEGYRFYDSQSPGLGSYSLDSLYSDIDSFAYFDGIHQLVFGYHRQLSKRFPFARYDRIIRNETVVCAILDCRRNPSWIKERLMRACNSLQRMRSTPR